MSTNTPYVCIGSVINSTCRSEIQCTDVISEDSRQEYFLIGVNLNGTFAYGISSSFVFQLDIYENKILLNFTTDFNLAVFWFYPHMLWM